MLSTLFELFRPPASNAVDMARERARRRALEMAQGAGEKREWDACDLPPLAQPGLQSIEQRAEAASPSQIRRWIAEIDGQRSLMSSNDREFAHALRLKLQHMLEAMHAVEARPPAATARTWNTRP